MRDFGDKRSTTWNLDKQASPAGLEPGKRTLVEMLPQPASVPDRPAESAPVQRKAAESAPVQREAAESAPVPATPRGPRLTIHDLFGRVQRKAGGAEPDTAAVHASARRGIATAASPLPYAERIQQLFGRHDISGIHAHTGADAAASARAMGAKAYATGDHVVLGEGADLHTVAHEAAHVIQQRGGVQLKGGVGQAGDVYERQADEVADRVVRGESAEGLLAERAATFASADVTCVTLEPPTAAAVQREVILDGQHYHSTLDIANTAYASREDARSVDEVLEFLEQAKNAIAGGVGRMSSTMRARIARLTMQCPSWIPQTAWKNVSVLREFRALHGIKERKEAYWKSAQTPEACRDVLLEEGYAEVRGVYQSYCETRDGQQAGYGSQLRAHIDELCTWTLDKIEPHYPDSQGETNRRADSLLIEGATQQPASQYYPPRDEPHAATRVDHKLGYRTEQTAQWLVPSVLHAARAVPFYLGGAPIPTTMRFQWPSAAPGAAQQVIEATARQQRAMAPSAFSGGLEINARQVLPSAKRDDVIKRQCGCAAKSDEDAAELIHRAVSDSLYEQGVMTQVGKQLEKFDSLALWFDDLCTDASRWLSVEEICKLCKNASH